MQRPNTTIDDVCATIGFSATIRLVGWFGGSNVYVPEQVDDGHKLAAVLGISAARALCSEFGSQTIWVPADPAGDRRRSYEVRKSVVNDKRCNVAEGIATLHEDTAVVGTGELLHEAS